MEDKTEKWHLLTDTLAIEQKKSQDLQCASVTEASGTEKAKSGHQEEQDKELKVLSSCVLEILTYNLFSIQLSAFRSLKSVSFSLCVEYSSEIMLHYK